MNLPQRQFHWDGQKWVPATPGTSPRKRPNVRVGVIVAVAVALVAAIAIPLGIWLLLALSEADKHSSSADSVSVPPTVPFSSSSVLPPSSQSQPTSAIGLVPCEPDDGLGTVDMCFPRGTMNEVVSFMKSQSFKCEKDVEFGEVECESYHGNKRVSATYRFSYSENKQKPDRFSILTAYGGPGQGHPEGWPLLTKAMANGTERTLKFLNPDIDQNEIDRLTRWIETMHADDGSDTCSPVLGTEVAFGELAIGCGRGTTMSIGGSGGQPVTSISRDIEVEPMHNNWRLREGG